MANVVVVGGGFAGLSAAARLAKLRHDVTLIESGSRLGGRLRGHEVDGATWPLDAETVTLPGVFRDLFRKSGRTMDRSLGMSLTGPQRHLFADRVRLDLPFGDRALQSDAIDAALGTELGIDSAARVWAGWIDAWPDAWEVLRRRLLDRVPGGRSDVDRAARRTLRVRRSVSWIVDRDVEDDHLYRLVLDPLDLDGQDARTTPSFVAVQHYLDRTFGRWEFDGGFAGLAAALETRLAERRVAVSLDETAHELTFSGSGEARSVTSVVTDRRALDADVVVWCAPTWPTGLQPPRALPAIPASRLLLTLAPDAPVLPRDLHAHAGPPMRLVAADTPPGQPRRCTVIHHVGAEDPVTTLVRAGLDLRDHVVHRHQLAPADLVRLGHWGWLWRGWSTMDHLPGIGPRHGVHFAGAHAWPGGQLEQIGMATAAIAAEVGPAPR